MHVRPPGGFAPEQDPQEAAWARRRFANVAVEEPDIARFGLRWARIAAMTNVRHHPSSSLEPHAILDPIAVPYDRFFFRRHEELAGRLNSEGRTTEFRPPSEWTPYGSYVHVCAKR